MENATANCYAIAIGIFEINPGWIGWLLASCTLYMYLWEPENDRKIKEEFPDNHTFIYAQVNILFAFWFHISETLFFDNVDTIVGPMPCLTHSHGTCEMRHIIFLFKAPFSSIHSHFTSARWLDWVKYISVTFTLT